MRSGVRALDSLPRKQRGRGMRPGLTLASQRVWDMWFGFTAARQRGVGHVAAGESPSPRSRRATCPALSACSQEGGIGDFALL